MTGFGGGTVTESDITAVAEIRSVNNRYHEVSMRLPKSLQNRELEIRELLRTNISRGKLSLSLVIENSRSTAIPVAVDEDAVRSCTRLLEQVRAASGISEEIGLDHILKFTEIFQVREVSADDGLEWRIALKAITQAIDQIKLMKLQEGRQLCDDLRARIELLNRHSVTVRRLFDGRVEAELQRVSERVRQFLTEDRIDPARLEQEVVMYAAKTDITEELVRLESHNKFFIEALDAAGSEGRKLTFLLQEMNREANTIASKSYDVEIAHIIVEMKEELERIREQLQNVE